MGDSQATSEQPPTTPSILTVPDDGETTYPTLGPLVCDWMESCLVFGPGDVRGEPLVLDNEQRAIIFRFYEIMPEDHAQAGRRRFHRCALSLAKGLRKTELAALVAAAELADDSPVRFDGWNGRGEPRGRPVRDPFVVCVAYTEEQSDELAYGALRVILQESTIAHRFDIGLERIMRAGGDGKAISLAGSPNARDGARTTFSLHDETHWHTLDKLKRAHQVMLNNLAKRKLAEPWALEVTTSYEPGEGSIAESTMQYARSINDGLSQDARLFFFHRQSSDEHDLETEEGARAAVIEASGEEAASWRDIDAIVELWRDPTTDRKYWERVWCNRPVQAGRKAFDLPAFRGLELELVVPDGSLIVVGFDGAQFRDATAIVCTDVRTGHQWVAGAWECPPGREGKWKVPTEEVELVMADLFARFNVWRLYADPPYWQQTIATWQGRFGDTRVIEWWTNRRRQMSDALRAYGTAIDEGSLSHSGDDVLVRHIGNAYRHDLPTLDENGKPLWLIRKEDSNSPFKIDAAMASILSWEARRDAIASGLSGEYETVFRESTLRYWESKPEKPEKPGNRYLLAYPANDKKPDPLVSVLMVLELRDDRAYYLLDLIRAELDQSERTDLLFELHRTYEPLRVAMEKRGLEADGPHIRDRQSREHYTFRVDELASKLSENERIRRLVPLFEEGRIVLPKNLETRPGVVEAFIRDELKPYPYGPHADELDLFSRILDTRTAFPKKQVAAMPTVFPSDF
jgi:phage terminase large subunit-like protein